MSDLTVFGLVFPAPAAFCDKTFAFKVAFLGWAAFDSVDDNFGVARAVARRSIVELLKTGFFVSWLGDWVLGFSFFIEIAVGTFPAGILLDVAGPLPPELLSAILF
jgi:hypothetical protein